MGAFSFAVDTLTSLSSAFASKNHASSPQAQLPNLVLEMDDQANRLFNEFSTGMKMLYKHGSRNPCNISVISQKNAKLLYTNLKANACFRATLAQINKSASVTDQWAWLPLTTNESISAGILFLPPNSTLSPNKAGASLTIHQSELHAPFSNHSCNKHIYLALEGCPELDIQYDFSKSTLSLKPGDSFSTDFTSSSIDQIRASQEYSLMLGIQLFEA